MFRRRRKKLPRLRPWVLGVLGGVALAGAIALYQGMKTASLIVERWSQPLFSAATRIYSAPVTLVVGTRIEPQAIQKYLKRLGYARVAHPAHAQGAFSQAGGQLMMCLRQPQVTVLQADHGCYRLNFTGGVLERIQKSGKDETDIDLEPLLLETLDEGRGELRTVVPLEEIPGLLRQGLVLMEDRNFYTHHGLSLRGIARALFNNLRGSDVMQGGSTLTQQLVKNFFLGSQRTLSRKLKEAWIAVLLELLHSKDTILEAYMNEVYLGQQGTRGVHGFAEAARVYFAQDLKTLSPAQLALLIGLVPSPGRFNPYVNLEAATQKRNIVLKRLFEAKILDRSAYKQATAEKVLPRGRQQDQRIAPYYVDELLNELKRKYPQTPYVGEGWVVQSTLHPLYQAALDETVAQSLPQLRKRFNDVEVAAVSVDAFNGHVLALVGGSSYGVTQFNRAAQGYRQVGSLVKPFIAALAFSKDVPPWHRLSNEKAEFSFQGQDWQPKNVNDRYTPEETLHTALRESLNVPFVNLSAELGFKSVMAVYQSLGFQRVKAVPSALLGAFEATPLEMARAYAVFPSGGYLPDITWVRWIHHKDKTLIKPEVNTRRVYASADAAMTVGALKDVVARGTAKRLEKLGLSQEVAGKTGTTNDGRDAWFAGFTSRVVTLIWLGSDQGSSRISSPYAVGIFGDYIKKLTESLGADPFVFPKSVDALSCPEFMGESYPIWVKRSIQVRGCRR